MPSEAAPGPGDGPVDEAAEEPEDDGLGDPVLDEEAQYRVVPPPKPHVEAKLRKEAKQVPHILIHKPFNRFCEICNQAKLREAPHRRSDGKSPHAEAKEFGDFTTGDFILTGREG